MRNLQCKRIQADEIWSFVGKKDSNVRVDDSSELGNAWVFVALDAETKLIPSYVVGKRDRATTYAFLTDLATAWPKNTAFRSPLTASCSTGRVSRMCSQDRPTSRR